MIIPAPQKLKRGKARPTAQLSELQRSILVWLFSQEQALEATENGKRSLQKIGIPWNGKRFVRDQSQKSKKGNDTDRQTVSAALAGLARRELIVKLGLKTSHVKMTQAAREAARYQIQHGMTPRQRYEESAKTYRMPAYFKERDELRLMMAEHERALGVFSENDGFLLEYPSLKFFDQDDYESDFEKGWNAKFAEYKVVVRRCGSVPYNEHEIRSATAAFARELQSWDDRVKHLSVVM